MHPLRSFALVALSIFCTPAFASLEPDFVQAGEQAYECSQAKPLDDCYSSAAAALGRYLESRPDRHKLFGAENRLFAGPRARLTGHPTDRVFVLVHSYTMGPDEDNALLEELARRGHNVFSIVLEGHASRSALGGGPVALKDAKRTDWRTDAHFGAQLAHAFGKKVILIGYSLGGLLSVLEGSAEHPIIDALLAVGPPVALDDQLWGGPGACAAKPLLVRGLDQRIAKWRPSSEWRQAYSADYLDGTCELLTLVTDFNHTGRSAGVINNAFKYEHLFQGEKVFCDQQRKDFAALKVPHVIIASPRDGVVDYQTLQRLTELASVKGTFLTSNAGYHLDYGLLRAGYDDRAQFLHALDLLEKLTP